MKRPYAFTAGFLVSLLALTTLPTAAQLAPASAAALGTGFNFTAMARGFASMGLNPAGLGMPGSPDFSLAFLPVTGAQSLSPISLSDLADVGGELIPPSKKSAWLEEIAAKGWQTGGGGADLTFLAFNAGSVGVQASTLVRTTASLNRDAAELILFGNAGLDGIAKDFDLGGSRMDALVVSTIGVGFGMPLSVSETGQGRNVVSVGGSLKYSVGHALVLAEDIGSQLLSDPLEVTISFPMIQSDTADLDPNQGGGIGLDLGIAVERGRWKGAVVVQNVFHTFNWDLDGMYFRSGEAFFDDDVSESNFDIEPMSLAPRALREAAEELKFKPQFTLGAAYELTPDISVSGDLRKRFGDGIQVSPDFHAGLGVEVRNLGFLPVRAGVAKITDGFLFGGGLSVVVGPVNLSWGGALQRGDVDGALASLTLSFNGF